MGFRSGMRAPVQFVQAPAGLRFVARWTPSIARAFCP
uniref:Uncharacterized protein n=1 Tax=Romanomermis culicivorax TaxID=13658 RepID=A0A915IHF5_ROMCU